MNIKSLLLGSAAALAVVSGAQAADAIVAAEPEPMEYVRVCDAFGTGYFYIPGTETCLKIGGRVRFDVYIADAYTNGSRTGTGTRSRAELFVDTASDTEYGALKTQFIGRWNFDDGTDIGGHYDSQSQALIAANISLGGFTVGLADTAYDTFVGYAGNVIQDDVIFYGVFETNQITYNYDAGNGFTAVVSLEDDNDYGYGDTTEKVVLADGTVTEVTVQRSEKGDWAPDVVAGVGYTAGSWGLKVVGGYDESVEEGAIKARLDATFGGVSAFLMGGWNTNGDKQNKFASTNTGNDFGWGDWAVWGGFTAPLAETANFNFQAAYSDQKTLALAANVAWTIVPGLTITPELNYSKWNNSIVDDDQWAGVVRFDRKF